jgi:sortase A
MNGEPRHEDGNAPGAIPAPGAPVQRRRLFWLERTLYAVAAVCLGAWLYAMVDARLFQTLEEWRLERRLAEAPAAVPELPGDDPGGAPPVQDLRVVPAGVEPGESLGRIEVPRLGLQVIVAEGVDDTTLRRAAGHIPGTPLPGAEGNVGIAAHRDSFFRPLKDVALGDEVVVTTPYGTFRYQVESTRIVMPEDVEVLDPTPERTLTLVTCYPFFYVGSAPQRFIVKARETAFEAPSAAVPAASAGAR